MRPSRRPCLPAPTVTEVMQSGRTLSCPGCPQVTSLSPLFPPTTLIIGDSITRNIRFFNAITRCLPGATVPVILDDLLNLLDSLPTSIKRIVVHLGKNDTTRGESEPTKNDFIHPHSWSRSWTFQQTPQPPHLAPVCQQNSQHGFH